MGVWAKATKADTPKAVVEATGEGLRSETEGEVSFSGGEGGGHPPITPEGSPIPENHFHLTEQTFFVSCIV